MADTEPIQESASSSRRCLSHHLNAVGRYDKVRKLAVFADLRVVERVALGGAEFIVIHLCGSTIAVWKRKMLVASCLQRAGY